MLDAGDILSRLRLDKTSFDKGMKQAYTYSRATMDRLAKQTRIATQGMSRDMQKFGQRSSATSRMFGKDWWKAFGQVAIGFTIAYRAMNVIEQGLRKLVDTFVQGRKVIDDFRMAIVETAASLQMLTEIPSTEGLEIYYAFAKDVFEKLEVIAAKHISTGEDLRSAYAKLVTMAVVPQTEEQLEQMARLVDLVVIQTRGLDKQRQIRTEIQAIITGEQKQGASVARMLNQRVEGYKDLIKTMEEETNVAARTEMLFKGIDKVLSSVGSVSEAILRTHTAWWTSLMSALNRIQRAGLNQMYEDQLDLMKGIKNALLDQNGLTELGIKLAKGLHDAWAMVWNVLKPVATILGEIIWLGNKLFGITYILKGWAGLLVMITKGWEKLGYLMQGDLEAVARVDEEMMAALDDIFMTHEQFRAKYMKQMTLDLEKMRKYFNEQKTGAEKLSEAIAKSLERWTKTIRDLKDEYIILEGVVKSFTEATYDPEAFKSAEWLWKTAKEWEKIPFPELKQEYMKLKIAMSELNKELVKMQASFELREQIKDLETVYEITRQLISEIEKGKLKPADVARRREELTVEAEYAALAAKTNAILAARYVLQKKEGIRQLKQLEDLIEKENLYAEALEAAAKAEADLQAEIAEGLRATMQSLDDLAAKWIAVTRTAAEVALESLTEVSTLWEMGLIDVEAFERAIDKIVEKYKDATKEMEEKSSEFAEVTKEALSDIFVDAMMGRLKDFEDYWKAFCEGLYRIFADILIDMVQDWIKAQAKMQAAKAVGGAGAEGAGGAGWAPWVVGAMLGANVLMAVLAHGKNVERSLEAQRRRAEELARVFKELMEEEDALLAVTNAMEAATKRINDRFQEYKNTVFSLGASIEQLNELEAKRAEVLAETRRRLAEEFIAPLEDMIAQFQLGPAAYEWYRLDQWYKDQLDYARALGMESVILLREAYELSKKELILKQQEMLLGTAEEARRIVATIGLSPMELQIYQLEEWRSRMEEINAAVAEEMDRIAGILGNYATEIAGLETQYEQAIRDLAKAESDYMASYTVLMERFIAEQTHLTRDQAEKLWRDVYATNVQYMEQYGVPNWNVEPWKSWFLGVYSLQQLYEEVAARTQPLIETIPGEIEAINASIEEQLALLAELAAQIDESGGTVAEAYAAQLAALTETFLGGLRDIIRSHTWSEYEQGLYDLNQWYLEQVAIMEALGIQTDLLTQAYDLQRQALLETALDQSDLTDELEEWRNMLVRLRDQILEIQTSLANPLDILERMALLENELTRLLGESWRAGVIATEGMSAEMVERVSDLLGQYLDMAADAFQRPSIEYQSIYGSVLDALMQLEEYAEETVTDLEIQLEQLEAQLRMVQLLEDMVNGSSLPGLQGGIDYVPRTGPYILHEGERVTPAGEGMAISITVNESATPQATGMAVKDEFIRLLRTDAGRKEIQQASRGR